MRIQLAYYTDKGAKKPNNEDALVIRTADTAQGPLVLAAVCDGVGGMDRGELASAMAVRSLSEWFDEKLPMFLCGGYDFGMLRSGLEFELRRISRALEERCGGAGSMGTTVTMLVWFGERCITANVGDSRTYEVGGTLCQLTKDHSLVQREIDLGALLPEEAEKDSRRNVLLQCLGRTSKLDPDIREWPVPDGALYLLCSDGFRHELQPEEISAELRACAPQGEEAMYNALGSLARRCIERGETDNITAVAVWAELQEVTVCGRDR